LSRCSTPLQCRVITEGSIVLKVEMVRSMIAGSVRRRGFAVIPIAEESRSILRAAVNTFAEDSMFRFPPILEHTIRPTFTDEYKCAFNLLYSVGLRTLADLVVEHDVHSNSRARALPCPRETVLEAALNPFQPSSLAPFEDHPSGNLTPFRATFFNIFNFNFGSLNTHRDRCLLTVVWGHHNQDPRLHDMPNQPIDHSRLWALPADHASEPHDASEPPKWVDMYAAVASACGTESQVLSCHSALCSRQSQRHQLVSSQQ